MFPLQLVLGRFRMKLSNAVSVLSAAVLFAALNAYMVESGTSHQPLSAANESALIAGQQADPKGKCDLNATCSACQPYTQCSPAVAWVWVTYGGPFGLGGYARIDYCLGTGGKAGCELPGTVKICRRFCTLSERCGNGYTDCGTLESRKCSDYVENPPPGMGHCSNEGCGFRGGNCQNCG